MAFCYGIKKKSTHAWERSIGRAPKMSQAKISEYFPYNFMLIDLNNMS
jgi:hypothetical protein